MVVSFPGQLGVRNEKGRLVLVYIFCEVGAHDELALQLSQYLYTLFCMLSIDKYGELKTELKKVEHQRDQTMRDFESLEKSFADLHQRYLKLKTASQTLQQVLPPPHPKHHSKLAGSRDAPERSWV